MNPSHVSRFDLMRLLARDLDRLQREVIEEHLVACAECRDAKAEVAEIQASGARVAPPLLIVERERPQSRMMIWGPIGAAAAAVIAVFVAVLPEQGGVRSKGTDSLLVFCRAPNAERAERCTSGDRVKPKTALMFEARLEGDRHLLLAGRDAASPWKVYFPREAKTSALVRQQQSDFLSASLVLDETPGTERFILFISDRPFELREVEPALAGAKPPAHIRALELALTKDRS
jgi:hypothetical protein